MGTEPEAMVCARCGRRFAAPEILQTGICPHCGGELKALEEAGEPDEAWGDNQGG